MWNGYRIFQDEMVVCGLNDLRDGHQAVWGVTGSFR